MGAFMLLLFSLHVYSLPRDWQVSRQLLDTDNTEVQQVVGEDQSKSQLLIHLENDVLEAAANFIIAQVQEDNLEAVIADIVNIVNTGNRRHSQKLSDVLTLVNSLDPATYRTILSTGLGNDQAIDRVNAFDRLLCLQTNWDKDLCYGFEETEDASAEQKATEVPHDILRKEASTEPDTGDYNNVETEPRTRQGQILLSQLNNGDYNSAAWTVVGSVDTFGRYDYARAINQAVIEGVGRTTGESMLQSLRLAARQGKQEQIAALLSQLLLQNYHKDVISMLAKATALASQQGIDGVQQTVRSAIEEAGNVRSIVEVMLQITLQGGNNGIRDMASVVAEIEDSEFVVVLVEILLHVFCRGQSTWDWFSLIYDKAAELFGCEQIETSFVSGIALASKECVAEFPPDLYASAPDHTPSQRCVGNQDCVLGSPIPNLLSCNLTSNYVSGVPLSQQSEFLEEMDGMQGYQLHTQIRQQQTLSSSIDTNTSLASLLQGVVNGNNQYQYEQYYEQKEPQSSLESSRDDAQNAQNAPMSASEDVGVSLQELSTLLGGGNREEATQKPRNPSTSENCMDISPSDNSTATCSERKEWGGCEKDWMIEENYCALTCGFCEAKTQTQVDEENSSKPRDVAETSDEESEVSSERVVAYKATQQTNDISEESVPVVASVENQTQQLQVSQQNAAVNIQSPQSQGQVLNENANGNQNPEDQYVESTIDNASGGTPTDSRQMEPLVSADCSDKVPSDNSSSTCAQRKKWGSCEKNWMIQGNYCALTCGFCELKQENRQADKVAPLTPTRAASVTSTPKPAPKQPSTTSTPQSRPASSIPTAPTPNIQTVTPKPSTTSTTPTPTASPRGSALIGLLSSFNDLISSQIEQDNDESSVLQKRVVGNDV